MSPRGSRPPCLPSVPTSCAISVSILGPSLPHRSSPCLHLSRLLSPAHPPLAEVPACPGLGHCTGPWLHSRPTQTSVSLAGCLLNRKIQQQGYSIWWPSLHSACGDTVLNDLHCSWHPEAQRHLVCMASISHVHGALGGYTGRVLLEGPLGICLRNEAQELCLGREEHVRVLAACSAWL